MTIMKPFRRTCRQFVDGRYAPHGNDGFIDDPRFAKAPEQYVRAFLIIQKDLRELFDYVEPADQNEGCYSYRIHELLMRTCVEVEANCKAILGENGYMPPRGKNWDRSDYKKLNATHRLSSFQVKFPVWHGRHAVRTPFFLGAHLGVTSHGTTRTMTPNTTDTSDSTKRTSEISWMP
jgi:hypothetical protein